MPIPAETVGRQMPWMTGSPYALWAHVRWMSKDGLTATPWSVPFGFNMRWRDTDVTKPLPAPTGLIRWEPIQGATAYQVLYPDLVPAIAFQTTTNVADEREFFTFHNKLGYDTIHWRVRAIRSVGQNLALDERPARGVVRAVEPDLHHGEHGARRRDAEADRHRVGRLGQGRQERQGARSDARFRLDADAHR